MTAKKNHIRNNLILLFVVLIAIPLLVLGFQSYNKSKQILEKNLVTNSESLTKEISTNIRTQLKFYEKNLMLMSQNPYIRDINNPESFPFAMQSLETLKNTFENIEFAYVGTNEKGMYQKPDWEPPSDYDPTSRPWYQNAVSKDGIAWTDPYLDTETNELVISCSTPIKKNGALVGVISIDLTLEDMANYIINSKIGENGYIFMMDSNLNFMAHQDSSLIGEALDIPKLRDAINASESGALEYTYKVDGKDDKRIATFIEIPGFNWIVASSVSKSEINKDTSFILNNTLTIGIISLIVALVVSIMYSISLTRPIQKLLSSLELVKKGDLTAKTDIKVKNEIGDLADSFNIMLENVSSLIRNANAVSESVEDASSSLAETSHSTSQASMEVTKTVEDIATGAGNQAEDAETCVQLASNLDSQFKDLIANNTEMVDLAKVIMEMNQNGINSVSTLDQKSSDNKLSIERIENAISELQEKSKHIGNILVTITSIADQTNLLALNASIEAARAGEHGRGFAVVADEIRKLAVESNSSADKINNIVVQIQKDTENTAVIMDEVLVSNREQEEAVDSVGKSFGEISSSITQMNSKIDMINNFVLNMDDSKNSIMESIESISAVSEETAAASEEVTASMEEQSASVEELASAAEQLKGLSESLNMEISKFKI